MIFSVALTLLHSAAEEDGALDMPFEDLMCYFGAAPPILGRLGPTELVHKAMAWGLRYSQLQHFERAFWETTAS